MRGATRKRYNMLDRQAATSSVHGLGTSSGPAREAGLFGCQKKYTKNITMRKPEEIKAFAESEGFKEQRCEYSHMGCGADCPSCGGAGVVYVMHETQWPPAAIEMMIADRERRDAVAAAAQAASVALRHARSPFDALKSSFAQFQSRETETALNEVVQRLTEISAAAAA